jgi:hypothetical protein
MINIHKHTERINMSLIGITGKSTDTINRALVLYAGSNLPSLVVDCANCANPHAFYPKLTLQAMQQIFIFELEQLYKFRDVLRQVPFHLNKINSKLVVVTTSDHLINYQNEDENMDIYIYAWKLMKKIGCRHNIFAGVSKDSYQLAYARKYADKLLEVDKWDTQLLHKE